MTVHVRDAKGAPVEECWLYAIPPAGIELAAGERWPHRSKDFPGGVAQLAVPPRPFRVQVHVYGGRREAIVGPFDPADLPERIDVTLPDP